MTSWASCRDKKITKNITETTFKKDFTSKQMKYKRGKFTDVQYNSIYLNSKKNLIERLEVYYCLFNDDDDGCKESCIYNKLKNRMVGGGRGSDCSQPKSQRTCLKFSSR